MHTESDPSPSDDLSREHREFGMGWALALTVPTLVQARNWTRIWTWLPWVKDPSSMLTVRTLEGTVQDARCWPLVDHEGWFVTETHRVARKSDDDYQEVAVGDLSSAQVRSMAYALYKMHDNAY